MNREQIIAWLTLEGCELTKLRSIWYCARGNKQWARISTDPRLDDTWDVDDREELQNGEVCLEWDALPADVLDDLYIALTRDCSNSEES